MPQDYKSVTYFKCDSIKFKELKASIFAAEEDYYLLESTPTSGEVFVKRWSVVLGYVHAPDRGQIGVWIKKKPQFVSEGMVWGKVNGIFG